MTEALKKSNESQADTVDGLDYADHQLINGPDFNDWPLDARRIHFFELREKYASNPLALEKIDNFDPETESYAQRKKLYEALKEGRIEDSNNIMEWFRTHYPLLNSR